jgi:hypothetical protein
MPSSLQSPGILSFETDLTAGVPGVATSVGAIGGVFRWGPIDELVLVDSEDTLKARFQAPTNFNAETWFTAANFLSYTDTLYVSRAAAATGNTISLTYVGNSTATAATGNSNVLLVGNTTNLSTGMILFASNNTALVDSLTSAAAPTITSIVNSTAITISQNATANITALALTFRENSVFSAVAQEVVDKTIDWEGHVIRNASTYQAHDGLFDTSVLYVARYAGGSGSSIRVAQCDSPTQFSSNVNLLANTATTDATLTGVSAVTGSNVVTITVAPLSTANAAQVTAANTLIGSVVSSIAVHDLIQTGNSSIGFQFLKVANVGTVSSTGNVFTVTVTTSQTYNLGANTTANTFTRFWEFYNSFDSAPGTSNYQTQFGNSAAKDEMHIVVVDQMGKFNGDPGSVLEVYRGVSRATDAKQVDGGTNYYKNIINQSSEYLYVANPRSTARANTAAFLTTSTATAPLDVQMYGGSSGPDELTVPLAQLTFAYDKFVSKEDVPDISLIMQGKPRGQNVSYNTQLGNYIIDNICEIRGDCVALITPDKKISVNNPNSEATDSVTARQAMRYSSYGILDSGYKYQYDRYNDLYRWVPLNGDIAGLCARTDLTNDAWWSPAGYTRGLIKNTTRLAFNPKQAFRDLLYKNDINPVITQAGAGTLLFGDKTMLGKQSAFSRINVRRLFIVLKKAISRAARAQLFEFNDDYTRSAFRNMVNPYLKDVQGRRGIEGFIVICDTSNNTPEVRQRNEFKATIGIKPAYAIDFIYLNFVAVRADVSFAEAFAR